MTAARVAARIPAANAVGISSLGGEALLVISLSRAIRPENGVHRRILTADPLGGLWHLRLSFAADTHL
jgi:hypothetical protein